MYKRSVDFVLAGLLLAITFPLLVIAAIVIKLESKGPVIFRRFGWAGVSGAFNF